MKIEKKIEDGAILEFFYNPINAIGTILLKNWADSKVIEIKTGESKEYNFDIGQETKVLNDSLRTKTYEEFILLYMPKFMPYQNEVGEWIIQDCKLDDWIDYIDQAVKFFITIAAESSKDDETVLAYFIKWIISPVVITQDDAGKALELFWDDIDRLFPRGDFFRQYQNKFSIIDSYNIEDFKISKIRSNFLGFWAANNFWKAVAMCINDKKLKGYLFLSIQNAIKDELKRNQRHAKRAPFDTSFDIESILDPTKNHIDNKHVQFTIRKALHHMNPLLSESDILDAYDQLLKKANKKDKINRKTLAKILKISDRTLRRKSQEIPPELKSFLS